MAQATDLLSKVASAAQATVRINALSVLGVCSTGQNPDSDVIAQCQQCH
jgi:hypothetical protein